MTQNIPIQNFKSFDEAADSVLQTMSRFIGVNTLFIAKNDKKDVEILKSFNRHDVILESGFETLYKDSY
jgi:hypothetical protein